VPTFSADTLLTFADAIFQAQGVPAAEAAIVARSLLDANLAGHDSHGLIRVMQYVKALEDGVLKAGVELSILHQTPAVLHCDAQWGLGQVQAHRLLQRLVPMARGLGLAAGTLLQCGHIGRLGEYGEAAAAHGLAFMASVNNHGFGRAVAPPGGKEGRIATNPLCMAVPTGARGQPADAIVLDIGTSVAAEGKIRVAFNKGEQVPPGFLLDGDGKPTRDPGTFYRQPYGTILPLGGSQAYKGFGLGLLLDMFVGGLAGSPCSRPEIQPRSANAVLFVVFDARHFAGMDHLLTEVNDLAENVRTCPRTEAGQEILLPGDPERQQRARRSKAGISLDDTTWGQLTELAGQLGVQVP